MGKKAYTLIELVLVIAIITLILGIAMPKLMTFFSEDELKRANLRIAGLIQEIRSRAMLEQRYYKIGFYLGTQKLWYDKSYNITLAEAERPDVSISKEVKVKAIDILGKGLKEEGEAEITISPMGYTELTAIYTVDSKGREMTLILPPFLTEIRSVEGHVDLVDH